MSMFTRSVSAASSAAFRFARTASASSKTASLFTFYDFVPSASVHMLPINHLVKSKEDVRPMSTICNDTEQRLTEKMAANYVEFERLGRDFNVPVPWGHIACREYGKPGAMPVLMTHGWLDNLNSWSQLIPYLLKNNPDLHIVVFDEPGCGFSSPKPRGVYYEALGTVVDMRRIVKHMNWDQLALIGHSKGSFYSFIYASLFPDTITQLISCDLAGPEITMSREMCDHIDQRVEMDLSFLQDTDGNRFNKVYTYEKALERFITSRPIFGMKKCVAEILLKRGMKPEKDGYVFTRDIQWNFFAVSIFPTRKSILELLGKMKCDIQLLTATDGPFRVPENFWNDYKESYKKTCRVFDDNFIKGQHYIHMDEAELLADKITSFLKKSQEAKLENKL